MITAAKKQNNPATSFKTTTAPFAQPDLESQTAPFHKEIESQRKLRDLVFPSLDEIYYCVKKGLVSKKQQILVKLILDFHEALFAQQSSSLARASEQLVPCSLKFYKSLSDEEMQNLLDSMQAIQMRVAPKLTAIRMAEADLSDKPSSDPFEQMF